MLQPGTLLSGRYKIEVLVGHGGMGTVYCAHDERLGREVAIKVLRPDLAADATACERFLREGQIAAQIVHPHVVRTFDAGEDPAGTYLVQEFLTGRTLDKILPLPPSRAAEIMRGIAAALGYMHSRGYIHCDVKPQNILIKDNGAPVLLDFGIARTEGVDTTTLIATPHYLAPERAQGVPASPASDLYALGIVLFQVVAGHPPFDGPDVHAIIQQHRETPVPPLPGADPAARVLDEIIARLTAKRPEDRYVSADAVGADLAAVGGNVLHDQPTVAVAPAQTVTNPAPAPGAAAAGPPVATSVGSPPGLAATLLPPRAAPAWRRGWFAILAIPLLLLLGFGIARPRRTQENGTASAPGLSAIVTSAPAASSISTTTQSQVVVPDLIGLQYDTARQMLTQRGLVAQKGETRKDVQVSGTVLQTDPPAGTPVAPNTAVTLQISAGPDKAVAPSAQDNPVKPPNTDNHGENPTNRNPDKGKGEGKEQGKGKH